MKVVVKIAEDRTGRYKAWCPALPGCRVGMAQMLFCINISITPEMPDMFRCRSWSLLMGAILLARKAWLL